MASASYTSQVLPKAEEIQPSVRYFQHFPPLTTLGLPRPIEAFWGSRPRIPDLVEKRAPVPSLSIQKRLPQYRGSYSAIAIASVGSLHAARRQGTLAHFKVKSPQLIRRCLTVNKFTMPNGKNVFVKDTSTKSTHLYKPADQKLEAQPNEDQSVTNGTEFGMDFEASTWDRLDKRIDVIVQQILPDMPHLVSVPTKTPYVREFPNENLNTPFEDWEVHKLQYMTLVSDGSRGVAWARGNWLEDLNPASPYSGFRSGTATPRSERDGPKIRTKISLADYKAGNKPSSSSQNSRLSVPQTVPSGQNSALKDPESPTQQLIDKIVQKSESKLLPRYSEKYLNDAKRPKKPEPPEPPEALPPADAPHPPPMPTPQSQAEEGRVVWPAPNKPDWKQPQQQEPLVAERARPKRSDYAVHSDNPQSPAEIQKYQATEPKRQKREEAREEKLTPKKGDSKKSPLNVNPLPPSKSSPALKAVSTDSAKPGTVLNAAKSTSTTRNSNLPKKPSAPSRTSQKETVGHKKQMSIDVNISGSINAMPPLLSPLPAGLISPDHPDTKNGSGTHRSEPNHISLPSTSQINTADAGRSLQDLVSPLESPFEMPRLLSPLPDWWLQKVEAAEAKLLHNFESESAAPNAGTHGARRERSRQPDTPGVARKTTKSNKTKSNLATDSIADYENSTSSKASEHSNRLDEKHGSNKVSQEKLLVKLKYGKRNSKPITRLLQMKARPVAEAKIAPSSGIESKKHNRTSDDIEEPPMKRSKFSNNNTALSLQSKEETVMPARVSEEGGHSSEKRPKIANKDEAAPNSSTSEAKKHPRTNGDIEEPPTKRAKAIGNADVQRARTPLTPNPQSPAPSSAQKTFNTPKKGDAMKSVAMRRVDSNDGQVLTPHGGSVSTPASTEKPRTSGVDSKSTDLEVLRSTQSKYTTIGMVLKRQADQILKIKEKDSGPVSDEDKRLGTVIAIEAVIAYMVGFHAGDLARQKERKVGYADPWSQFLPFMDFATDRAKGQGELFTLALLLNALSRECLERIYMERIQADPAGTGPPHLKEIAKNSHSRQAAWSAYREQCKEHHPVEFIISVEEAKTVAISVLTDYCKKMNIAWETKLEF